MSDTRIPRSALKDPVGIRYWPFNPGRDPARTPMQWNDSLNAGFTTGDPWLPVNKAYTQVNVSAQEVENDSLLNWYRELLKIRRRQPALQAGDYRTVQSGSDIFVYERRLDDEQILIALNFSNQPQAVQLPDVSNWEILLAYPSTAVENLAGPRITLAPYAILIVRPAAHN